MSATKKDSKTAVYEAVTNLFIEGLKKGIVGWKKPFFNTEFGNPVTGTMYQGFNPCLLSLYNSIFGFESKLFVTFNQAKTICENNFLKKGSKGCPLVYYNVLIKQITDKDKNPLFDKDGKPLVKRFGMLKYFTVFNIDCLTDEAKEKVLKNNKVGEPLDNKENQTAEAVIENWTDKPMIHQSNGDKAYYSPLQDHIVIPTINNHYTSNEYYSTLFHESIHATGHQTRLNREGITNFDKFGSHQYSYEELIAEIGASMLCHITGITETVENSQAYINSWITKLGSNPSWIYQAAKEASKAVDHILGTEDLDSEEHED